MGLVSSDWHTGVGGWHCLVVSIGMRNVGGLKWNTHSLCSREGVFLPSVVGMQILKP